MFYYRFITTRLAQHNPQNSTWLNAAHNRGLKEITGIDYQDLYIVEGNLSLDMQQRLALLLHDPLIERCQISVSEDTAFQDIQTHQSTDQQIIERVLKPGVTDTIAMEIQRATQASGIHQINRIASGQRWLMNTCKPLKSETWQKIVRQLGIETITHQCKLGTFQGLATLYLPSASTTALPEMIELCNLDADALIKLSQTRRLALNLSEMKAIQNYFQQQKREPSDIELEMIAQTWSEHCSHKSFQALIQYGKHSINGLLKHYLRTATESIAAPWVASAFIDNAGIIDFDDEWQLAFKVETHNHPSAIEPFGGSNTGLGGVIRDILGVSAQPIAATDVLGFGLPNMPFEAIPLGSLHPRVTYEGVIAGIEDYGNKVGIPTVNGAVVYDRGYTLNPLVYCGCLGLLPKGRHPRQAQVGDRIIVIGGRTGRDGLGGATFSSQTMEAEGGGVLGAVVQIGNPIIARGLIEVVKRARDQALYHAINDCGAGGFSSAVGEMAHQSGCGINIDLTRAPLKYAGLKAWEIWLSESQERMILAVDSESLPALQDLCSCYEIELSDLGCLTDSSSLVVRYGSALVLELDREFLYETGMPRKQFQVQPFEADKQLKHITQIPDASTPDYEQLLLKLLNHPNIASKAAIIRRYDHEVQGGTVIRPLVGYKQDGPSDACVLKPRGTSGLKGCVLSNGINPELGKYDPYRMALSVVDEAIRNAVAVGANPKRIAILDNFCWGDVERPETLAALVECVRGCHDAALHYQTPFISGKDSLNNEYQSAGHQRESIPGTLLISALGVIEDVTQAVSMDFKAAGNLIYLLGETKPEWGGNHLIHCGSKVPNYIVPSLPAHTPQLYEALYQSIRQNWIRACHDLSEGGLSVALAEMCIAGRLGCSVVFNSQQLDPLTTLFVESNGRFLIEVTPQDNEALVAFFKAQKLDSQLHFMGQVEANPVLRIQQRSKVLMVLPVSELCNAWQAS